MRPYERPTSVPANRDSQYTRASRRTAFTFLATVSLVALAACGKGDDAMKGDSALGRDLAMAASDTSVQPKLQDVPTNPPAAAPSSTAPAPKPKPKPTTSAPAPSPTPVPKAPAVAKSGTIDAGTSLKFEASGKVCSNTTAVGEKFTAPLAQSVTGSNGATIPAGATGTFEVTSARTAKNSGDSTHLRVRLISITFNGNSYPVETTLQTASTDRVRSASKSTDAKKVAGGAVIGAIAGQIIGKNTKGTVIGAAAGAAAGTAAAAATADYDTCINSGAAIAVRLDGPVVVKIAAE